MVGAVRAADIRRVFHRLPGAVHLRHLLELLLVHHGHRRQVHRLAELRARHQRDSDDYIDQDYILEYLKAPIETELVIQSISDYLKDDPNIDFHIEYHFPNKLYKNKEIGQFYSTEHIYKYGTTWSRLYKRSIIIENKLLFNKNYSAKEDVEFAINYLQYCNLIYTTSYEGYHYLYYPSSLSKKNKMTYIDFHNVAYDI